MPKTKARHIPPLGLDVPVQLVEITSAHLFLLLVDTVSNSTLLLVTYIPHLTLLCYSMKKIIIA